jgi:hypothetical protein
MSASDWHSKIAVSSQNDSAEGHSTAALTPTSTRTSCRSMTRRRRIGSRRWSRSDWLGRTHVAYLFGACAALVQQPYTAMLTGGQSTLRYQMTAVYAEAAWPRHCGSKYLCTVPDPDAV